MPQPQRILVVEDDPGLRSLVRESLTMASYPADVAADGLAADRMLGERNYGVVVSDLRLPGLDGLGLFSKHARKKGRPRFVFMSGVGTVDEAVRAMKLGAFDFLTKPFRLRDLVRRVQQAMDSNISASGDREMPVGQSPAFNRALEQIHLVAPLSTTVLFTGETGTGKEMAARYLHNRSERAKGPFVPLHCGAIPETLLEDELFGHARGAYTGATEDRAGCFQMAEGGTLLLDEIGTMSPVLQSKLLRVVQDREVRPLGSTHSQRIDVRLVVSTNADLEALVEAGDFRADLYYRLSSFPIRLPALRDRGSDSAHLARHFAHEFGRRVRGEPMSLGPETEEAILAHDWPGNIRELQNTIERAIILSDDEDTLSADCMREAIAQSAICRLEGIGSLTLPEEGVSFSELVSDLERQLLKKSLERTGGNKKKAAELLGLKRTTLIEKLKRLGTL